MCIALWLLETRPQYRFILALNRDEVYSRPTQAVHWWEEENADIVGGKDCVAGGTWLASSINGRLAFVTNFREPTSSTQAKSRGHLITSFLKSSKTPMEFANELAEEGEEYNGFNLILIDLCSCKIAYVTNRAEGSSWSVKEVSPGMHVLSNAQLDTPWPKVQRIRHKFEELLKKYGQDEIPETQIIENVMKDTVYADRSLLPATGCDPDWEYKLSPIFIYSDSDRGPYGTRSMVVLSLKPTSEMTFYEQYLEDGKWKEHKITYEIKSDKSNCESEDLDLNTVGDPLIDSYIPNTRHENIPQSVHKNNASSYGNDCTNISNMAGQNSEIQMSEEDLATNTEETPLEGSLKFKDTGGNRLGHIIYDMEQDGFQYVPPLRSCPPNSYVSYMKKKVTGEKSHIVIHADYFILLRACARVIKVNAFVLHRCILKIEKELGSIEDRIAGVLKENL